MDLLCWLDVVFWAPFRGELVVAKCKGLPWLSPQASPFSTLI